MKSQPGKEFILASHPSNATILHQGNYTKDLNENLIQKSRIKISNIRIPLFTKSQHPKRLETFDLCHESWYTATPRNQIT